MFQLAQTDEEIEGCYPVLSQLRTNIGKAEFLRRIKMQMKKGYHLAYIEDESVIFSVAGFRLGECLAWGRYVYVEDLVSEQKARSKGYGQRLLHELIRFAKARNCGEIHLDSGVQRFEAHKFYLREGMKISSHHFSLKLGEESV